MTAPAMQRKPFWAPLGLAAASALGAALVMVLLAWLLVTAKATTVVVVSAVETASDGAAAGEPAALDSEGRARAETLARMFGDARLKTFDAIYVGPAAAAQAAAQPLSERLGIKPAILAPQATRAWARRVVGEHRGGRILVVARGEAARELAAELSGVEDIPPILPPQFATMYIVTVPRIGRADLLSVNY